MWERDFEGIVAKRADAGYEAATAGGSIQEPRLLVGRGPMGAVFDSPMTKRVALMGRRPVSVTTQRWG
jgi:hypothetical protein